MFNKHANFWTFPSTFASGYSNTILKAKPKKTKGKTKGKHKEKNGRKFLDSVNASIFLCVFLGRIYFLNRGTIHHEKNKKTKKPRKVEGREGQGEG